LDTLLEDTIQHVRKVVKGMRPEMLNYGLVAGLQTLVDDLSDSLPEGLPEISLEIETSDIRLDPNVELNLFRVVQQACQNALRHAAAHRIRISGWVKEDQVVLRVEDDGKGFEFQGRIDLADLLARAHYGLAGMHERASVIGAVLELQTSPGKGTCVQLVWTKPNPKDTH
jgi:signal transduction histidine kinase